ncbi:6067_t:CDS:2 [Funneliformis mosseae]|uniref:6067_t:CDS:1 n=1 Tax=Funneliformis mosseae TaxID=27381 RepID=A0A9N8W569_FUNMO|nr:6067_t:CDS:2 [Funneliformis mosseae]
METIKVTYNSISRRFNIDTSTTWTELESKLRSLYKIPTTTSLNVSYTDEDGDVITLSSDLEFKEVLAQQSSGRPIKLVLNTANNNESWVLEGGNNESESNVENELSSEDISNNLNLFEDSSYLAEEQQITEREEEAANKQSIPFLRKEGPRFGLFDRPYFGSESFSRGPFRGSIYNPCNSYAYGHPQFYRSAFFNKCGGPSTYYFGRQSDSCGHKFKACNKSPKQQSDASDKNAEASSSASANNGCDKSDRNRDYRSKPSCNRNFNFFNPRYYNQAPFTQEQLKDKLATLHSMGFNSSNDASYEDLLKRYNGNLERVIELLLRDQQFNEHEASANASKGPKGIVINDENAQNKFNDEKNAEDVNEESKPYSL